MISKRSEQSREVTSMLNTLRGEAFRRQRNLQGLHAFPPSLVLGPSLPPMLAGEADNEDHRQCDQLTHSPPADKAAGPPPPRSWVSSKPSSSVVSSPEWRSHALSLILRYVPSHSPALAPCPNVCVPPLFQLCMHTALFKLGGIPPECFPALPRHILREYVRYCAVHAPSLPKEVLAALWAVDDAGSADGELIITGSFPDAVLSRSSESPDIVLRDWDFVSDTVEPDGPPPLHTFIVLLSPSSSSRMSLLPPTLTHLALLAVEKFPLQLLPVQLPLLTVLDLSFNPWISEKCRRVAWRKWTKLEVLGLRGCGISDTDIWSIRLDVNQGRLTDVDIVLTT